MRRGILFLLCSGWALTQDRQSDPFERAVQSSNAARDQGNFVEAAARREEARTLLVETPVDSSPFVNRVQQIHQIYQNSGRRAQARALVQDALERANSLGESHPVRIPLLNMLADSWQADGNLLKAVVYREQAVAAVEAAPASATQAAAYPSRLGGSFSVRSKWFNAQILPQPGALGNKSFQYQQLAELYRQLGRLESAAKALAKVHSLVQDDPRALAAFYESQGNTGEAAALYRKISEQAAVNPKAQIWDVVAPLQSLASLYQREQRWDDAAAALEQAASRLEASGVPQAATQAPSLRINLANLLQQAGRTEDADQVYQTLFSETASDAHAQVLQAYADHLSATNRAGQGEDLLKTYLSDHPDLPSGQETNMLFALSRAAGSAGHDKLAEEYRQAARDRQLAMQAPQPPGRPLIGPDLEKARVAVQAGHLDQGVNLTSKAIASASAAQDGDQIAWQAPSIASLLANKKAADKGDQLYEELLAQLQTTSVDNMSPLLQAQQQYVCFLIGQKNRWAAVPAAMERYREAVVAAYGADTAEFNQTILLRSEFARASGAPVEAEHAAEELLAHEASLSGVTSQPYLQIAQTAAGIYQGSGQPERAVELRLQAVAIADLILPANAPERASVRMNAANALAGMRRLDEAERLASEAVGLARQLPQSQADTFVRQLDQIRRMQTAARRDASVPKYY